MSSNPSIPPWDPQRSCSDLTPEEAIHRLYKRRGKKMSLMEATAYGVLKNYTAACDTAQDHSLTHFCTLFKKRCSEFTCSQFETLCRRDMRYFAMRRRPAGEKERIISIDATLASSGEGEYSLLDLLPAPEELSPTELEELLAVLRRAHSDLPEKDRVVISYLVPELTGEDKIASNEPVADKDRKAKSRAWFNFTALCKVHEETESREGLKTIERAVFVLITSPEDSALANEHLLRRKSLDELKKPTETRDDVRFRFLRVAHTILCVVDRIRTRALDFLPKEQGNIVRAYFLATPHQSIIQIGQTLQCSENEVWLKLRGALADLSVLRSACEYARSSNRKGRSELKEFGTILREPDGPLFLRVLVGGESLSDLARQYGLTDDEARVIILNTAKQFFSRNK